jgi:8-oxo-dGTP pyrophosphatase MutT (NUDIX family)
MTAISIARFERLDLTFAPQPWPFADARRSEIDRHFDALKQMKPIWNGRMLLMHRHKQDGESFSGGYLETDFASFLAWRDWGCPDTGVKNCFGMGALRGCDGPFLLGVMAQRTANAGMVYFPAGLPDPTDIVGRTVDLAGNVLREVEEETGLRPGDFDPEPGWYSVFDGPRIAQMRVLRSRETAAALRVRILDHLARIPEPELSDIRIAGSHADLEPTMPPYVTAFLDHVWSTER